ncbi:MAG: DinB family protein, partial [Solirubrobacterales bacterium]
MTASSREAIADRLAEARRRTFDLIEPLDDEQLNRVYSPILSPLAWDLGHIANFEELWLVQTIGRREPLRGDLGRFYDAIENPRRTRGELPILRDAELRAYLADVRERTLEVLDEVAIDPHAEDPLLREGFVYQMLIAHEHQHNETMLQLLQMVEGYELPAALGAFGSVGHLPPG